MRASQTNLLVRADSSDGGVHPDVLADYLVEDFLRNHPEQGIHEDSDSVQPSSWARSSARSRSSVDHRLKYWKNMLAQRRALQQKLRSQMGRDPQQMMLSRLSSTKSLGVSGFKEVVGLPIHSAAEALDLEPLPEAIKEKGSIGILKVLDERIQDWPGEILKCGDCSTGLCVRINGVHFRPNVPDFSPIVEPYFICDPFQRLLRTVIRIENSGWRELHFCWRRTEFFSNNDTLFRAESWDFVFDTDPFFLPPGAFRDVSVLYQPRCVAIVKQRWLLVPRPEIFLYRPCGITLNLHGCCTPPKEFLERLAMERPRVPTPLKLPPDKPASYLCPYARELEEREVFRQNNRSFQCRSHADMERLKNFFELVKPLNGLLPWNFSVHTLIHRVCAVKDARERIRLFLELTRLLDDLRENSGQPLHAEDTPDRLRERRNTKLIYVRGVLASHLQDWEDRVQCLRAGRPVGFEKSSKYFFDHICMMLHGQICQAAEDIASVIESTAWI